MNLKSEKRLKVNLNLWRTQVLEKLGAPRYKWHQYAKAVPVVIRGSGYDIG